MTEYLPRIEGSFSLIKHLVKEDLTESYWEITTNDNETSIYGNSWKSRIYNPDNKSQIFEWLITESTDSKGNKIVYKYKSENKGQVKDSVWEKNHSYNNQYIQSISYGNYFDENQKEQFAFEVIFNYGEYDLSNLDKGNKNPYEPSRKWKYRTDPFSSFKSGFEIRTCRLCSDILLFHKFADELGDPCLVKALSLKYIQQENYGNVKTSGCSTLQSATLIGYQRKGKKATDKYEVQEMPPTEFDFSTFSPPENPLFQQLEIDSHSIPGYLNDYGFQALDLNREGISGLLYNNGNALMYLEPEGEGKYSAPKSLDLFPTNKNLKNSRASLVDLDGNGELELMIKNDNEAGYYEKDDTGWRNFVAFNTNSTNFSNSNMEMVGLSNNGKTDLLLADIDDLLIYPSEGKKGFSGPKRVPRKDDFPLIKKGYRQELVTFSNIFGDGLSHRIKISNGSVECWPDLGYGEFGEKITPRECSDFWRQL